MNYHVLARKWRPQTFTDVVGQEHVLIPLANSLSLGKVHHAYLLSGTRGVGKTTIARLLAKGLNCETGITATPCGQCNNCQEIKECRFVDLIEIDAASRTKVEDTRELLDDLQYAPARGRFKVYLIDEVHMLSRHSFNALLKTLEEPPAHVRFLLATTDPQKLPVTVLSRCLRFHLKALNVEQIYSQLSTVLQQEDIIAAPRALQLLARAAEGSMRDALSLTDQAIAMGQGKVSTEAVSQMLGTLKTDHPLALVEAIANADGRAMIALLAQYADCGMSWEALLLAMLSLLHRLAMMQLLPDQFNNEEDPEIIPRLRELAHVLSPVDLQFYYQTLLIGRKELPFVPNPRMGVEMTLLRALAFCPTVSSDHVKTYTGTTSPYIEKGQLGATPNVTSLVGVTDDSRVDSHSKERNTVTSGMLSGFHGDGRMTTVSITKKIVSTSGYAVYGDGCSGNPLSLNTLRQNVDKGHISMQAPPIENSPVSVSVGALSLTNERSSSLLGVVPTSVWSTVTVDSEDGNLIQPCVSSRFDGDNERVDWQPGVVRAADRYPFAALPPASGGSPLTDVILQLLQARAALRRQRRREGQKTKKAGVFLAYQEAAVSGVERPITAEELVTHHLSAAVRKDSVKSRSNDYQPNGGQQTEAKPALVTAQKAVLRTVLDHEKIPEKLLLSLADESLESDLLVVQPRRLAAPKLAQHLAMNYCQEEELSSSKACMHLHASRCHLNSEITQQQDALRDILSTNLDAPVGLTGMEEDNNQVIKTSLEWRQASYEKKRMLARRAIITDSNIQMLRYFFDAVLDEDSIQPV